MPKQLTIYTGATFDLPHAGHVNFLHACSQLGRVVVSLNTDEFIKAYKGQPPVMTYEERATLVSAIRYVDQVIPNSGGADSTIAIETIQPDIIAIGSDWARKDYYAQMNFTQDWLDSRNISLIYIPYTDGISTTDIKSRLALR